MSEFKAHFLTTGCPRKPSNWSYISLISSDFTQCDLQHTYVSLFDNWKKNNLSCIRQIIRRRFEIQWALTHFIPLMWSHFRRNPNRIRQNVSICTRHYVLNATFMRRPWQLQSTARIINGGMFTNDFGIGEVSQPV